MFYPVRPWNLIDDFEKQEDNSTMLHQALCIISKPSVNPSLSYSPESSNSCQNQRLLSGLTLKFDGCPWKTIGHLFYAASCVVYHFIAISVSKLELPFGNPQFGSKSVTFCDLQVWWMALKTLGDLFYTTLSFAYHFKAISEFKL